jgi:hypothetical protein
MPLPEDTLKNATTSTFVLYAQIALAAGERGYAEQWLRRIYRQLEVTEFPRLRKRADEIARQL